MDLECVGYSHVGPLKFGDPLERCVREFGDPDCENRQNGNELNLHYSDKICRFSGKDNLFVEATLIPGAIGSINGVNISWNPDFLKSVLILDSSPLEYLGFVVLDDIGLSMTGFHDDDSSQLAITLYSSGRWSTFLSKGRPFTLL